MPVITKRTEAFYLVHLPKEDDWEGVLLFYLSFSGWAVHYIVNRMETLGAKLSLQKYTNVILVLMLRGQA